MQWSIAAALEPNKWRRNFYHLSFRPITRLMAFGGNVPIKTGCCVVECRAGQFCVVRTIWGHRCLLFGTYHMIDCVYNSSINPLFFFYKILNQSSNAYNCSLQGLFSTHHQKPQLQLKFTLICNFFYLKNCSNDSRSAFFTTIYTTEWKYIFTKVSSIIRHLMTPYIEPLLHVMRYFLWKR